MIIILRAPRGVTRIGAKHATSSITTSPKKKQWSAKVHIDAHRSGRKGNRRVKIVT
jgi:hypothetical protein